MDLLIDSILGLLAASVLTTGAIFTKSVVNYSRPGPSLEKEIVQRYLHYAIYALLRLTFFLFVLSSIIAIPGVFLFGVLKIGGIIDSSPVYSFLLCFGVICIHFTYQFAKLLFYEPGTLAANSNYRLSRFHAFWRLLSPRLFSTIQTGYFSIVTLACGIVIFSYRDTHNEFVIFSILSFAAYIYVLVSWLSKPGFLAKTRYNSPIDTRNNGASATPNILMIGCDTLRADRVNGGYHRNLTPNIAKLQQRSITFSECTVPIARTAPSLASLLTGCWPSTHGLRTNFTEASDFEASSYSLPRILRPRGYETTAISDWVGSDFGKYDFGFEKTDLPEDQWNLRYLIRQGPKDIRMVLSLFTHNRFGKSFIPELYFLPGRPLVTDLGDAAIAQMTRNAKSNRPFFLNVFMSATHPPFSSEFPYYTKFSNPSYKGESKFCMSRLNDPMDIIRAQKEPRTSFDLDQIIDLYDGCVARFDDEVGRIISYLEETGLDENTIVVIYSLL